MRQRTWTSTIDRNREASKAIPSVEIVISEWEQGNR